MTLLSLSLFQLDKVNIYIKDGGNTSKTKSHVVKLTLDTPVYDTIISIWSS